MTKAQKHQVHGRITRLERLTNSFSGNPRWAVTLEVGGLGTFEQTWNTASDASLNYEVGNKGLRVDSKVVATVNGRGTIQYLVPA